MRLNFDFLQLDGLPLTNNTMDMLQQAYSIFDVLGDVAGHMTILQGCEPIGDTSFAPGVVAINGEVLYFEGGLKADTVYVKSEEIKKVFKNQETKVLAVKKTVKFGNWFEPNLFAWAAFTRLDTLKELQIKANAAATQQQLAVMQAQIDVLIQKTAPIVNGGIVIPWRKPVAEIPDGWKECTDLRGKTVVGLDPNDNDFKNLWGTFGSKTHTLSVEELPNHNHIQGSESLYNFYGGGLEVGNRTYEITTNPAIKSYKQQLTGGTGSGHAHNNVQPSRIAYWIEPNFS